MHFMKSLRILNGSVLAALTLAGLTLPALASAQTTGGMRLPANYLSRFSSTELAAANDSGYGVRYFPLPFEQDIRFSVVRDQKYWEYNIGTRIKDTTFTAGVFNNGYTADAGIPKVEITHDPDQGFQYSGMLEGNGAYSRFAGGYAFRVLDNRVRILNNAGLIFQDRTVARTQPDGSTAQVPDSVGTVYTQTEVGGGYSKDLSTQFRVGVNSTARLYTFPVYKQYQASVDVTPNLTFKVTPRLTIDASHLERFAKGDIPVAGVNFGRYEESYATVTYRLPAGSTLGMLRSRLTKNWIGDGEGRGGNAYLRNDVLFNVDGLPSLVGPSVGYQWSGSTSRWLFSLAFAPK